MSYQPIPIPGTETLRWKENFISRYSQLTDWDIFRYYSTCFLRRSIRINTILGDLHAIKSSIENKGWILEPIPWCSDGFFIFNPHRKDVGNLLEHHLGQIYVQEAVSMVPPLVLNPQPDDLVLDMCASPGSKTTQMGAMMQNQGLIVANDYKGSRLQSLGINVQRSALTNTIVTLMSGKRFYQHNFDKILVDAPCSGTGTIRKSLKTVNIWNPLMIKKIARTQKELIRRAYENLKPGGEMVYSTCSLEPEENEGVVDYLLQEFSGAKIIPSSLAGLKSSPPVLQFEGAPYHPQIAGALRLWPQDNDTEGFFVAKIYKGS